MDPLTHSYNLARLGNAGDIVTITAGPEERAAIARWAGLPALAAFAGKVNIRKIGPTRFGLDYTLTADVTQSCVVTLEPVESHLERNFHRELHFTGPRRAPESESLVDAGEDELPEEIESLHYDLAGPLLEEFSLALDPYPRRPGVEFSPPEEAVPARHNPFAVLKSLKSGS